jgi:hypothetical protein
MSIPKLHPSIILYSVGQREQADVILDGRIVYSGSHASEYAERVSAELWQVELTAPVKPRRTPRNEDMLWG